MITITRQTAQDIVDTISDVCDSNINFFNTDGIIIASSDCSRINTFHEIGLKVIRSGLTIEVNNDDNYLGTKTGINIPISHNGHIIAAIGISGEPAIVRKYAYLAQRITGILLKEREVDELGIQKKNRINYIIRSIVKSEPINSDYFNDFIQKYNLTANTPCRIILIHLAAKYNPKNLFMIQDEITSAIEATDTRLFTYNYPNQYIIIIRNENIKYKIETLKKLLSPFEQIITIGVGNVTPVTALNISYNNALLAMNSQPDTFMTIYDNLDFELIVGNTSNELKQQFLNKTIHSLEPSDIELLKVYYSSDMSLSKTCDCLFMHKNSLQYKLNRIYNLTGYNPRKFKDAVVLYTAIQML